MKPMKGKTKSLVFSALFAALSCVVTYVFIIPLPYGYLNVGDIVVLLAGWCLGGIYGGVAAAIGSALADILSGFAVYAPATFIIKGLVAFSAYYLYAFFKKIFPWEKLGVFPRVFAAVIAEALMILGYFLYECALYKIGGAVASLFGNAMQGICCAIGGVALISAMYPVSAVRRCFPALKCFQEGEAPVKEEEK